MPSRGSVSVPSRSKRIAFIGVIGSPPARGRPARRLTGGSVRRQPVQNEGALHLDAQLEAFLVEVEARAVAGRRVLDGHVRRRAAQAPEESRDFLLEEGEVLRAADL